MTELLPQLVTLALPVLLLASVLLVIFNDWRLSFAALAAQYVCAAVLITQIVLWQVAAVKLLVGLLVVIILWITGRQVNFARQPAPHAPLPLYPQTFTFPTGFPFRVMAAMMAVVAAWYTANQSNFVLPGLQGAVALNIASYVLVALALLNLGLTEEPMNAGVGLLTLLTGFELFYAAVEPSLAIVALLAAVEFGVALAVSYLALLQYAAAEKAAPD